MTIIANNYYFLAAKISNIFEIIYNYLNLWRNNLHLPQKLCIFASVIGRYVSEHLRKGQIFDFCRL